MHDDITKMALSVATMHAPEPEHDRYGLPPMPFGWVKKAGDERQLGQSVHRNHDANLGVVKSYEGIYRDTQSPILAYLHDDVECKEMGWDQLVLAEFDDPTVGLVGFGGAKQHGAADIYKTPYVLQQLGRTGYLSNTTDAEVHGKRFNGATDVAVLDGFALVVRRDVLDKAWLRTDPTFYGGWPVDHLTFHCYDYYLCCMARRLGYRIRVVGVRCHHHGGMTSTTKQYQDWLASKGMYDVEDHQQSHQWIYEEFRDVLPWGCA